MDMVNIPAQLIIGSKIFEKLSIDEQNCFTLYRRYIDFIDNEWYGDNFFYDRDDLLEFWGVKNINEISGNVYFRDFVNLSRDEEQKWKSMCEDGKQLKIFWC